MGRGSSDDESQVVQLRYTLPVYVQVDLKSRKVLSATIDESGETELEPDEPSDMDDETFLDALAVTREAKWPEPELRWVGPCDSDPPTS